MGVKEYHYLTSHPWAQPMFILLSRSMWIWFSLLHSCQNYQVVKELDCQLAASSSLTSSSSFLYGFASSSALKNLATESYPNYWSFLQFNCPEKTITRCTIFMIGTYSRSTFARHLKSTQSPLSRLHLTSFNKSPPAQRKKERKNTFHGFVTDLAACNID